MKPTRRLISTLTLLVALGGAVACDPEDNAADSGNAGSTASAQPSKGASAGGDSDEGDGSEDCGKPPTPPAGHKIIEIVQHSVHGGPTGIRDTKPYCTPNDFKWGGTGKMKFLKLADDAKAQLSTGSGSWKTVSVGELENHADDCKTNMGAVKEPFTCSGNVYDITLNSEGQADTVKEIWFP